MKIKVYVEKSDEYFGATQNIPGIVVASGTTFDLMKKDLLSALEFYKEDCDPKTKKLLDNEIVFIYDIGLKDFFNEFKVINKTKFAERIGISPSLLRQYTSKKEIYISESRAAKIINEIHALGQELLSVSFS